MFTRSKDTLVFILFYFYSLIPLKLVHILGSLFGIAAFKVSKKFAFRVKKNILFFSKKNKINNPKAIIITNIKELGKSLFESPIFWVKKKDVLLKLIKKVNNEKILLENLKEKKGLIILTPHIGCVEIVPKFYSCYKQCAILFRPSKIKSLRKLMLNGRSDSKIFPAPTNFKGIRILLKFLKENKIIGILPDQVPKCNDGIWTQFFNKRAFTMNLVERLHKKTGCNIIFVYSIRLKDKFGYEIHVDNLIKNKKSSITQNMNDTIEKIISSYPDQYLWSYNRFKNPTKK